MKNSIKENIVRCIILFIGLIIAHFGVTLYLLADLGSDPFNVLVQGVFRRVSAVLPLGIITHGNIHIIICVIIILILLITDKTYIKIGTVICMLFGGPIIDFFTYILSDIYRKAHPVWIDIVVCVSACIILAFGMTVVIKSNAGTGPNDLVSVVISDKTNKKFGIIRIIIDAVFVLIGFLLGSSIGVGTAICVFVVGPVAEKFMPFCEKTINRILNKI